MGLRQPKKNLPQHAVLPSSPHTEASPYHKFDNLDGDHPWMSEMPEGYVAYQVRELGYGEVSYFNFALAKEMGLISTQHPHHLTKDLKEKIIKNCCC